MSGLGYYLHVAVIDDGKRTSASWTVACSPRDRKSAQGYVYRARKKGLRGRVVKFMVPA